MGRWAAGKEKATIILPQPRGPHGPSLSGDPQQISFPSPFYASSCVALTWVWDLCPYS